VVGVARSLPSTARPRILVVSARIGGGHDAAARALIEAVRQRWPRAHIRWVDTLDAMGPGVGPAFCWTYATSVEHAPWLYELFYAATWHVGWFRRASKRFTGSWAGRRLAPEIDAFAPELILSTYPLGSGGLAWLRRHRGLTVPTLAWVTDFAPHPFWVYGDLDLTLVLHEVAVPVARIAEPSTNVAVSALPVQRDFRPGDQVAARRRYGLPSDAFVVLLSCGTFAFGVRESVVRALLDVDDRVHVVVACGRNRAALARLERLRVRLRHRDAHEGGHLRPAWRRLLPLGWTDDMAGVNQAADVVVTNAGGATALEAIATGRRVLMLDPIPAHGTANASLMAVAGLAEVCRSPAELAARVRTLVDEAGAEAPGLAAREPLPGQDLAGQVVELATNAVAASTVDPGELEVGTPGPVWPMRPQDAFFTRAERDGEPQELGVVLELEPPESGPPVDLDVLVRLFTERLPHLPPLRRQPMRRGAKLGWSPCVDVDVRAHLAERVVHSPEEAAEAIDAFWSTPIPRDRPLWQALLVRPPADGGYQLALKLHHSVGDGLSALGLLENLWDAEADPSRGAHAGDHIERGERGRIRPHGARRARGGLGEYGGLRTALQTLRGLARLAVQGGAPAHPLNRVASTPDGSQTEPSAASRTVVAAALAADELRRTARRHGVRTFELALAVMGEVVDRMLRPAGLLAPGRPLRAFVPLTVRPRTPWRVFGNWTTAVTVELPTGPRAPAERLARIRTGLHRGVARGEPVAAAFVTGLAGHLPAAAHAWFARHTYTSRFLNLVVTYLPGPRETRRLAGAKVRAIYPVAPLTRGVPLTIGMVTTGTTAGIGLLADRRLGLDAKTLTATVRDVMQDFAEG
jgi:diacylglycerol O-acyltransferase